jgi:hypothetical protein
MGVSAATVRRLALSLPETAESPHHDMTSFRVAGKIFATMPPEGGRVHVFVGDDEVSASIAEYPAAVEELLWGDEAARLPRAPRAGHGTARARAAHGVVARQGAEEGAGRFRRVSGAQRLADYTSPAICRSTYCRMPPWR